MDRDCATSYSTSSCRTLPLTSVHLRFPWKYLCLKLSAPFGAWCALDCQRWLSIPIQTFQMIWVHRSLFVNKMTSCDTETVEYNLCVQLESTNSISDPKCRAHYEKHPAGNGWAQIRPATAPNRVLGTPEVWETSPCFLLFQVFSCQTATKLDLLEESGELQQILSTWMPTPHEYGLFPRRPNLPWPAQLGWFRPHFKL